MIEELLDMSGKCSSGYAFRLVNVLSGFDDFQVKISHYDRLKSLFNHNITQYMKEDPNYDDLVLELAEKPINRKLFQSFLQNMTIKISEDLYDEFIEDINDEDYYTYIRKISMEYEGYSME